MDPQSEAPYFDRLADYVKSRVLSFHMPGHQQGTGAPEEFVALVGQAALAADITQVQGIDDIHRPYDGCLKAQQLAAQAYGSERCHFLVNGSTCGNQAMLMAALDPGETVLVPRNAHSSTISGLLLSEARPVYYQPPFDPEMGVFHVPTPQQLEPLLDQNPEARALFLTSPTYYGAAGDLEGLVALARRRGLLVLVDEAWGAHLAFHPSLPLSAVHAGADLVVQSSHKLVSGFSQAAMLHAVGQRVDPARLEAVLRLLQTTSPNSLLVASLDTARRQLALHGRALLEEVLQLADRARTGLARAGARVWQRRPGVYAWDDTRLLFQLPGFTGYEVERRLRRQFGIQLEMSDCRNLVGLVTLGHRPDQVDRLVQAVAELIGQPPEDRQPAPQPQLPALPESRLTLKQAFLAPWESIPWAEAAGRICVDTVCPYPPGIPWLLPGEVPSPALIEGLQSELAAGVTVQGAYDPQFKTVRVVKE